ncbi:MAG TPA: DoxX family protein [Burkholderiaceae bacterium]|nr:DoxX family protein [Burkholderiaceae bacterium]
MNAEGLLVARLFLGVPFVIWGIQKLPGGEAHLVPVLQGMGLPGATFLAYMVGLCEFVGGVMVVLGYPARTAGVLLGLWCLVTAYVSHKGNTTQQLSHTSMAGGFFLLAAVGPGSLALFGGQPSGIWALLP